MMWKTVLRRQLGAAIQMLEHAVRACPGDVWAARDDEFAFWRIAFHTLFFLDVFVSGSDQGFAPPPPFGLSELDPQGAAPERIYTPDELLAYAAHCRERTFAAVDALTDENADDVCRFAWIEIGRTELLLYNLRHLHHHVGQLNLILRQSGIVPPRWVRESD
jgi:hypothetical protein